MAQDTGTDEQHQEEAQQLRAEIEDLVKQAHLLLRGGGNAQAAPKTAHPKRAERERELEAALEKTEWYRREIRRLRQELGNREQLGPGQNDASDRDPMEIKNRLVELRRELQRVHRSGEGLDRVAAAQRRAEAAQNAMHPDVEEKLKAMKKEVEAQKRQNVKLQAERMKLTGERKAAEEEVRAAGSNLRSKAAQIQKGSREQSKEPRRGESSLKSLRRDLDILRTAVQGDERRFQANQEAEVREVETATAQIAALQESIAERETELSRLNVELHVDRGTPRRGLHELHAAPALFTSGAEGPADGVIRSEVEGGQDDNQLEDESDVDDGA